MSSPDGPQRRVELRERRAALGVEERHEAADALADRLTALCSQVDARRIGLYAAIDGELDVDPAAIALRQRGVQTWYPAVDASGLSFRQWDGAAPRLAGRYGIAEPPLGPALDIADLDVVVVPVVAFDAGGNRLGFGAGYYDRALGAIEATRRPTTVGVAFDFQELPQWEPESHDVALDIVLTPTRSLRCRADGDASGGGGPVG